MHPVVAKPETVKRLCRVDIVPLLTRIETISEAVWAAEDSRKENKFECFHHTRHIVFRFIAGNRDPDDFYDGPAWPIWAPLVRPIMSDAVAAYGYGDPEYPKVMLARLAAGHQIDRHTDGAGSNLRTHKIHVPLVTNPHAVMTIGDEDHHLEAGWAYEVNNITAHAVRNDGDADRIHLIFECYDRAAAA